MPVEIRNRQGAGAGTCEAVAMAAVPLTGAL
jgi:hypothetical protein